jgi:hypothetical protein
LIYCFSETGQIKWKKVIQKSQYSQANGLGLSFHSQDAVKICLICCAMRAQRVAISIFFPSILQMDLWQNKINLLPDAKFEFSKRYACWLADKTVILFGIAPANINKRTLMLMEY